MADMSPRLAKLFLSMTERHYPERLGHFILLEAPVLFRGLWDCVQPFVDPVTKKKVRGREGSRVLSRRTRAPR